MKRDAQRLMPTALVNIDKPVVVFGASVVGELLVYELSLRGIKPVCYADNSTAKVGSTLRDLKVVAASKVKELFPDPVFVIGAADIGDIVDQLARLGFQHWMAGCDFLEGADYVGYPVSATPEFIEFAAGASISCQQAYLNPDRIFFRSVDIVITERCSLRCRDCSNLMQYYERPQNVGMDEAIGSIDAFCAAVDDIHEFRVIGGEPFMNKNYPAVVRHLVSKENVKRIVIYTNGTIVPKGDQLAALAHEKVMILLTDYGPLSPKSAELIEVLKANNIDYFARPADGWSECASIMPHHRTEEKQKEVFASCCAKNLYTLSEGKLYRCPFVANAVRLEAIPDTQGDYVDVMSIEKLGREHVRQQIRNLTRVDVLKSCDYCIGRPLDAPTVTPGIQAAKPINYVKLAPRASQPGSGVSERRD
jgi:organic radical activating enzyme